MEIDADGPRDRLRGEAGRAQADSRRSAATAWPRWASTSSRPGSSSSSSAATPRGTAAATTSAATSSRRSSTRHRVFAYPFLDENRKQNAYWRDVGTLDAYYEANMDLVSVDPQLNMYDEQWPIRTYQPNSPPPKFVFAAQERRGYALDSIVCLGSIVSGGQVRRSILGPTTRVNSYAQVEDSILFDGVDIGRHAQIRRAIIDKGVSHSGRHRDRLRPRPGSPARLHRHRQRRDRHRQDRRHRAFPARGRANRNPPEFRRIGAATCRASTIDGVPQARISLTTWACSTPVSRWSRPW